MPPSRPAGERVLRELEELYADAERRIRALLRSAAGGADRAVALRAALAILLAIREPGRARYGVELAYMEAGRLVGRELDAGAVSRLAGGLELRLDRALEQVAERSRIAFTAAGDVAELELDAVTAHVDRRGTRWPLGGYTEMASSTVGRRASSYGVRDGVGPRGRLTVSGGGCGYCAGKLGDVDVDGELPPFHPSCTCVASAG